MKQCTNINTNGSLLYTFVVGVDTSVSSRGIGRVSVMGALLVSSSISNLQTLEKSDTV